MVVHFALEEDSKSLKSVNFNGPDEEILDCFGQVDADLVCFFGHLHSRRFSTAYNGAYFLNPGAVGCTHDGVADYAVIDMFRGAFQIAQRRVPYDRQALLARYDELEIPARQFIRKVFFGVTVGEQPVAADGCCVPTLNRCVMQKKRRRMIENKQQETLFDEMKGSQCKTGKNI